MLSMFHFFYKNHNIDLLQLGFFTRHEVMINQNVLYYGHHSLRHGQCVLRFTMIFSPCSLIITTIPCHYLSGCLQSLPLPRENVDEILHCFRITGILSAISLSFLFPCPLRCLTGMNLQSMGNYSLCLNF